MALAYIGSRQNKLKKLGIVINIEKEFKNCCFTGYRPAKFGFDFGGNITQYKELENKLIDAVFSLPAEKCFKFYCGMAMGFDILAGETVAMLKRLNKSARISLVAVIPFKGQADNWPDDWKKRYNALLKCADSIVYISEKYHKNCFFARNRYMVDNSDIVITWYDGKPGGTASTLRYASGMGKKIINLAENGCHDYYLESPYVYYEDE